MGWITQCYGGEVHVVPDTEAGHVLEQACFCGPEVVEVPGGWLVSHRDEMQRITGDTVLEPGGPAL